MKLLKIIFVLFILSGDCLFSSSKEVIFYAGFEGNVNGYGKDYIYPNLFRTKGIKYPTPFIYEKGIIGKSAYFSWDVGYPGIAYPVLNNFNTEKGTISFWIKKKGEFYINRYYPRIYPVFGREGFTGLGGIPLNDKRVSVIEDGKWHHFVYTWDISEKKKKQYLDGELIYKGNYKGLPLQNYMVFGYRLPGNMDEIVILNSPLNDAEIKNVYRMYKDGKHPFSPPSPEKNLLPFDISRFFNQTFPAAEINLANIKPVFQNEKRKVYTLAGKWLFQPADFKKLLEGKEDEWAYINVPGIWLPGGSLYDKNGKKLNRWKGRNITDYTCGIYRINFKVSKEWKNRKFLLHLKDIQAFSDWHSAGNGSLIYINGKYAGKILNGEEKYFDLSKNILFNNENIIDIVNGYGYTELKKAGISSTPLIEIIKNNKIVLGKPLIVTSYRDKKLSIILPVKNISNSNLSLSVTAKIYDYKTNKIIQSLPSKNIKIENNFDGEKKLIFPVSLNNLILWSPETPHLYNLVIEIKRNNKLLDVLPPYTFGFREIWVENGEIYLNGNRFSIRGSSHNYLQGYGFSRRDIKLRKATGQNADRTGRPQFEQLKTLKVADEEGWAVLYNSPPDKELLKMIGNHPSVIAWLIPGNGYVNGPHGHPVQIGAVISEDIRKNNEFYKKIEKYKEIDPTRLYAYYRLGVGGDFRSIMHYLGFGTPIQTIEEWPSYWAKNKQDPLVPVEISLMLFPPELKMWQKGSKEIILPEQCTKYFGQNAYRKVNKSLAETSNLQNRGLWKWFLSDLALDVKGLVYKNALRSWRTYGINGYLLHIDGKTNITYTDGKLNKFGKILKENNSSFLFYIGGDKKDFVSKDHNYFSGEEIKKSFIIINDHFYEIEGQILWEIKTGEKVVKQGKEKFSSSPGSIKFLPLNFTAPSVSEKRKFIIYACVKDVKGKILSKDTFNFSVFPESKISLNKEKKIALIDSTGETEEVLKLMGISYTLVNEDVVDRGLSSLSNFSLLIIGKNSYPEAVKLFKEHLPVIETVKEGLNIIVMEQRNRYVMGLKTENFNTRRVFILAKNSPLFNGLSDTDFSNWRGESQMLPPYPSWNEKSDWHSGRDSKHGQLNSFGQRRFWHWSNKGMVATFCFEKPQAGNFKILLENGFDLLYTPLVEFRYGKGKILLNQLDIIDHYGIEPVATLLFERMIEEMIKPAEMLNKGTGYIGNSEGKEILKVLNIEHTEGLTGNVSFIFSGKNFSLTDNVKSNIENYLSKGGTIVISIQNQSGVDVLPVRLKIEKKDYFKTEIPGNPIFSGISLSDFYFRKIIKIPQITEINGKQVKNGVIGVIPYKKGKIVYIQISPDMFKNPWQKTKVWRIYSAVFTNLNIKSKNLININLIGGYGLQEEWLPGYGVDIKNIEKRPMVKESPFYIKSPLNFDPEQHHVW